MSIKYLYHCVNKTVEGDNLLPTYEGTINGKENTYLFAADKLTKALAFSFSYHTGEVRLNGDIDNSPNEFVVLCGGQQTLDKPREIKVFSFPNENFEQVDQTCQWVSTQPVQLDQTNLIIETHTINTLLECGLQVFVMDKTIEELQQSGELERSSQELQEHGSIPYIQRLYQNEGLRWINKERGINPCPSLQKQLEPAGNTFPNAEAKPLPP